MTQPLPSSQPATLYADDTAANRRYLKVMLEQLGLPTQLAEDGIQALALWQQQRQPLVLLDVHMPGMDGAEVARRIRLEQGADTQVVILGITADMNDELREALQLAGMDDCIAKPTSAQALQAALSPWLGGQPSATAAEPDPAPFSLREDTELVTRLIEELPRDIASLQAAFGAQDEARMRALAHQISGVAAMYQLPHLRLAVETLEQGLKNHATPDAQVMDAVANAMAEDLLDLQSAL